MPRKSSTLGKRITQNNPLMKGQACTRCRARRVRCSGEEPCQACLRTARFESRDLAPGECTFTSVPAGRRRNSTSATRKTKSASRKRTARPRSASSNQDEPNSATSTPESPVAGPSSLPGSPVASEYRAEPLRSHSNSTNDSYASKFSSSCENSTRPSSRAHSAEPADNEKRATCDDNVHDGVTATTNTTALKPFDFGYPRSTSPASLPEASSLAHGMTTAPFTQSASDSNPKADSIRIANPPILALPRPSPFIATTNLPLAASLPHYALPSPKFQLNAPRIFSLPPLAPSISAFVDPVLPPTNHFTGTTPSSSSYFDLPPLQPTSCDPFSYDVWATTLQPPIAGLTTPAFYQH